MEDSILGAEGIVIHGNKIVLGMQKSNRWYILKNGEKAAIVKTLGGAIEEVDGKNTKIAINSNLCDIKCYVTKSEKEITIPENYAIMVPKEIKDFLRSIEENEKNKSCLKIS